VRARRAAPAASTSGSAAPTTNRFSAKEPEAFVRHFLALTPRGRLAAPAFRAVFAAKRMIKAKPALWAAVQFLRRFRAG